MKRFKTGFSLAEVLLTLAIVSIIATIGFTMSRKGIEKAYNGYIYNGYNSLTIAIAEANARGHAFNGENFSSKEDVKKDDSDYGFCNAVKDVLTTTKPANQTAFVGYNIANVFKQFLIGSNGIITGAGVYVEEPETDEGFELPDVDRGDDEQGLRPPEDGSGGDSEDASVPIINNSYTIDSNATSNGISYKFKLDENGLPYSKNLTIPQITNNNNGNLEFLPNSTETKTCSYILITMDVPAMKYKDSNNQFKETKSYEFMYFYETDYPLIPTDSELTKGSELLTDVSKLAYTIDDGETGRMINGTYKPRSYYSFKEAACRVYGDIRYDQEKYLFGDECPQGNTPVLGSMLLVNPVSILH